MLERLALLENLIGNTPLVPIKDSALNLYAKLECSNQMGSSIKSRAAHYVIRKAIERSDIREDSVIVESSSGNFALGLAVICKVLGLQFIPVIDPNINRVYKDMLNVLCSQIIEVDVRDETGGYLLSRLKTVQTLLDTYKDRAFWTNQYANDDIMRCHYEGVGEEIASGLPSIDYAFIGVGSGGTIAGVSKKLKERFPDIKVIAVDSEGSVIFGDAPQKRYIPGIGSSIVPSILRHAEIDDVVRVAERDAVKGCRELLYSHGIYAGGSSGSVFCAVHKYFASHAVHGHPTVVFICPDGGMPYNETVFNEHWVSSIWN